MLASIGPNPAQLEAFAQSGPEGPIFMVNLLKYRDHASYEANRPEAKESLSGRAAYLRYGEIARKHIAGVGGSIVWTGAQALVFIGGPEQEWDDVLCVRYPSRQKFFEMVANPKYDAGLYHRDAGLERTCVLCCRPGDMT